VALCTQECEATKHEKWNEWVHARKRKPSGLPRTGSGAPDGDILKVIVAEALAPHRCLRDLLPTCKATEFKLNFPHLPCPTRKRSGVFFVVCLCFEIH
jgi:hypothetical protein